MLKKLQQEQKIWADYNFPNKQSWHPLMGAVEELGELAHAHLKTDQGIRTNKPLEELAKNAIGDIIIYLVGYCSQMGFDLESIVEETWQEVKQRDWIKYPMNGKTE